MAAQGTADEAGGPAEPGGVSEGDGSVPGQTVPAEPAPSPGLTSLGLAALGVVFGDIGTSPLYTLKTAIELAGGRPSPATVLGVLSLIIWTLVVVTTIKYVSFAMRVANDGEGGIVALMALLGLKRHNRPLIIAIGLLGAALIYGDGAITPAISVLSAVEGLEDVAGSLKPLVIPVSVAILAALFLVQPQGTARIGRAFGPIMLAWFLVLGVLGLGGIIAHPSVLVALNPVHGLRYLASSGYTGFLLLGAVFLCVTGAEALYADMGQFGARPIRLAWLLVVFPSLVLNYAGQAAVVIEDGTSGGNVFYRLCPQVLLAPMIVLATLATIIASQSIITGAFSMTRQAMRLGWMPSMRVTQTSEEGYGQVYVGAVNWLLMLATIALTLAFRKSDNLAAAYGIAVSATMLITSALLYIAMREIWGWNRATSGAVAGVFLLVDGTFFLANMTKFADGGYVPVALALVVYALMYIWHRGIAAIAEQVAENPVPIDAFVTQLASAGIARVPGTAVFLTRSRQDTPPVVTWYVARSHALQRCVIAIHITTQSRPWIEAARRVAVTRLAPGFWRAEAHYGFMERPDVPALLDELETMGCGLDRSQITYFVGLETIVAREDGAGLPRWLVAAFAAMQRNAARVTDVLNFPRDRVVELGRVVAL
jgi:KUP system potassium uptake protein